MSDLSNHIGKGRPMNRLLCPIAAVIVFLLAACSHAPRSADNPPAENRPFPEMEGWFTTEPLNYDKTNLHEYIDGAAELFYQYGFMKVSVAEYARRGTEDSITAEIYEMNSSDNAFGIFSYESRGMSAPGGNPIGGQAAFSRGCLNFWKGAHYVKVYPTYSDEKLGSDVLALGHRMSDAIVTNGNVPILVSLLPADRLVPGSVCFVPAGGPAAELDMPEGVRAPEGFKSVVVAAYALDKDRRMLVMLAEMPEAVERPETTVEKLPSGKGFRGRITQGNFTGCVGDSDSRETVEAMVRKIEEKLAGAK
jgi:hypothetical protein